MFSPSLLKIVVSFTQGSCEPKAFPFYLGRPGMRQNVRSNIVKRRLQLCTLIHKNHVISIQTAFVSVAVSRKRQPEPLQNGLCHQEKCVWNSDFMPWSDLLSTNAVTVIRVMINMNTVMPARLWPCRQVDFGSSFLEILIPW